MHAALRWLGIAAITVVSATASADDVLKPYVVLMLDTSGSMIGTSAVTGSGPPTCGGRDNRLNHARCAINRIVNSYGDMVFALGRFRMASSGTVGSGESCDADGDGDGVEGFNNGVAFGDECVSNGVAGDNCTPADTGGELLTALVDGNNQAAATWTDFSCGSCGTSLNGDPEIWGAEGNTPLEGYMASAHLYWRGVENATSNSSTTIWPSTSPGFDPIRNDPTNLAFLPSGCDPSPACTTNCCASQCRTYMTIMLTDGAETCDGNAETVLQNMLQTDIDNRRYRIETRVIGFGITPGDADIERYAQAGGRPDLPGAYEGYYASDEASLQLALSQILADAVKVETCNDIDDDCDGTADEDFLPPTSVPGKGGTCDNGQLGQCARTGMLECRADGAGLECNAPQITPGVEALPCNGLDDDCDGRIDENLGCTSCVPTGEICDGNDNDCDGVADQVCRCSNNNSVRCDDSTDCGGAECDCTPLTRPCGTNACSGIETCTGPNTYTGCTAQQPDPAGESCNGLDDDCDGICDGLTDDCSDMVTTGGPGADNPGHPSNDPIAQNICRPGTKTCGISCGQPKDWNACSGEILPCNGQLPCTDPCNGIDDDCDNLLDEDFQSADCSTNCGMGATVCQNGAIVCNSVMQGVDNTCNNQDEDCDNKFDEGWLCPDEDSNMMCDACDVGTVCNGVPRCVNGAVICEGDLVGNETCNCLDDNCDGQPDNAPNDQLCPGGGTCLPGFCQCAFECTNDEFPCPLGKRCEATATGDYCVNDPCFNVTCPAQPSGNAQTCRPRPGFPNEAECVDTCTTITCTGGLVCHGPSGECRPDNCLTFPERCAANENCIGGTCIPNPCQDVTCDAGTYCVGGECVQSCSDVDCPAGQRCRMGMCEADPCGEPCPFGESCNDTTGECIEDPCKFRECPMGQWCNPNSTQCEEDPCVSSAITCPNPDDVCRGGSCFDPDQINTGPDGGTGMYVTVGGGGCSTSDGDTSVYFALALALVLVLRRRRAAVAIVGLALASTQLSCSVNQYCVGCEVDDAGGGGSDDALVDADSGSDGGMVDAGCLPTGPEICDGEDNDCNGLVDDGSLPGVGDDCDNVMGNCAGGKKICSPTGVLRCDKLPMPEVCDGEDNNCNGAADEGDPGGGGKCGTDQGECVAGTNVCNTTTGMIECVGFIDRRNDPEECDGQDDDCDGVIDDGIGSLGTCGPTTDVGDCNIGTLVCQGGAAVCQNAVFPAFEACNGEDDDCDGSADEIFDFLTDPRNCGDCNVVCPTPSRTCINSSNAGADCTVAGDCPGGSCAINSQPVCESDGGTPPTGVCDYNCNPGFIDHDGMAANGCEYRCFPTGPEVCDGVDNDCDGSVDNGLTAPAICLAGGECGMTAPVAQCMGSMGWRCTYPGNVQFPETRCDGLNNDCDANIDENQPNVGQACNDGGLGECQGTGVFECDTTSETTRNGPARCEVTDPGSTAAPQETCDDKDNDCDGKTDEGSETGDLLGQEWVSIGGGHEIMKYEASRRDATMDQQGTRAGVTVATITANGATQSGTTATFTTTAAHTLTVGAKVRVSGVGVSGYNGIWTVATVPATTTFTAVLATTGLAASGGGTVAKYIGACSKEGAIPWTNVTYPEALAVCEAMGASLCSETRWHQACSVVPPRTFPVMIDNGTTSTGGTRIEAEDFLRNVAAGGPETACNGTTDDDGDGRANDGCPAVSGGTGIDPDCSNNDDDDADGRINDGCPTMEEGGESGDQCNNNSDDDGDGRDNDGCPETFSGGPETICTGTSNNDDDGDGRANDGCPAFGARAETGSECNNNFDDDNDGRDNDGCPAVVQGAGPETICTGTSNNDNDGDGRANDGCPAFITGAGPETGNDCDNNDDDDNDGFVNDGCPVFIGGAEVGAQCDNNTDDDGDTFANDGCPSLGPQSWQEDYTPAPDPHSGIANMRALANLGSAVSAANALTSSPWLEYQINIPEAATNWRVWVRMYSPTGADDRVHVNVSSSATPVAPTTATSQTLETSVNNQWIWMSTGDFNLPAGEQYVRLFMEDDGLKVDAIFIARTGTPQPPTALDSNGNTWSYATNADTYQATTCNGADRNVANDDIMATGANAMCYADHTAGDVFDMSGNVKEWTLARAPGQNPIRGGASNDTATGTSCGLNFILGTDTFFFPNVGFRCCR